MSERKRIPTDREAPRIGLQERKEQNKTGWKRLVEQVYGMRG